MPYIKQEKRDQLEHALHEAHNALVGMELDDPENNMEGNLNYFITSLLNKVYTTPSYREINDAIGLLECVKLEYYRRKAAPYENQKVFDNGDVYEPPLEHHIL